MTRLYSLYTRKRNERTWTRISDYSYPKAAAIRIFQFRLLDAALSGYYDSEMRLRPIKIEPKKAR